MDKINTDIEFFQKMREEAKKKREQELRDQQAEIVQLEAKSKQAIINKKFDDACIPKRFQNLSFEQYKCDTPEQAEAFKRCKAFADNFDAVLEKGACMFLGGKTGTGKTHLSCSIANKVIGDGYSAVFSSVSDIAREMRDSYKSSVTTETDVLNKFMLPQLLIIDEVGVQKGSHAEKMLLTDLINKRYENMLPTILIGNITRDEAASDDILGHRIMDRFEQNSRFVKFDWQSYRKRSNGVLNKFCALSGITYLGGV